MKKHNQVILILFITLSNLSYSQNEKIKMIYGKWQVYSEIMPFRNNKSPNLNSIWIFNDDGNLLLNDAKYKYELNDEGSEFMLNNHKYLYHVIDTILRIEIKILPHESHVLKLKKVK